MHRLLFVALLLVSFAAFAQQLRGDTTLFIGQEVCQWATEHVPDSDVAYQGGVDVDGNQVAPADAPALSIAEQQQQEINSRLLRQMTLQLTSDLATQLGIPDKMAQETLNVGTVEMDSLDRPTINGVPLVNPDPHAWQAACDQAVNP